MRFQSRFLVGTIAALLVLVMSPAAFGQVNMTIQYNSSPKEIQTNRSAYTADPDSQGAYTVIATLSSTSLAITGTTLIVDYPAIVTTGRATGSGVTAPAAGTHFSGFPFNGNVEGYAASAAENTPVNLQINGSSGMFGGASTPIITTVNYSTGQVYILLPFEGSPNATQGGAVTAQTGGAFRLENARIDANGLTAPAIATSILTSTANGYQITSLSSGNVIDALAAGIASVSLTSSSQANPDTAVVYTDRTRADSSFKIFVTEGFSSAWWNEGLGDFFDTTNTRDTELRISFTGIPAGVTITLTGSSTNGGTSVFSPSTITSSDNVSTVTWTTTQLDRTATTVLTVTGTVGSISSSSGCCAVGSVTATVSMSPVGAGNIAATTTAPMLPDNTLTIPRFAAAEVGPVTVVTITTAKTTFLLPLAFSLPTLHYDTGISVANTTKDPFGSNGGATASTGTLTFSFFPRTATGAGTPVTLTTSATTLVGAGLDASGNVPSGGTFTVLLSELWAKAGQTGDFTGYIFIEGNFLLGHGVAYITTFRGDFTAEAPMLELAAPAVTARGTTNNLLTY